MPQYVILSAGNINELQSKVNEALRHPGVKLIGGVSMIGDQYGSLWLLSQAVLYP